MRKANESWPTSPGARLAAIVQLQTQLPIREVAKIVGVSTATYKGPLRELPPQVPLPRVPLFLFSRLKDLKLSPAGRWLMLYLSTMIDSDGQAEFVPEVAEKTSAVTIGLTEKIWKICPKTLRVRAIEGVPDMFTGRKPPLKLRFDMSELLAVEESQ